MTPRRDISLTTEELQLLLSEPLNAALTTLDRDGWPHPTAMWFIPGEDSVRMWTYAKSQKAVNLRRDPRCALLVERGSLYPELRGVLIRGAASLLEDRDEVRAIGVGLHERYVEPSMGLPAQGAILEEIERQAAKRLGILVPFERVASWDHRKL
jgi:PPOX class probable F420-dependent enzyme